MQNLVSWVQDRAVPYLQEHPTKLAATVGAVTLASLPIIYSKWIKKYPTGVAYCPMPYYKFDWKEPHLALKKIHDEYGKNAYVNMVGFTYLSINDWDLIRNIYDNRDIFPMPDFMRDAVTANSGRTMFTSEGEEWRQRHRVLDPLFTVKMLTEHFNETLIPKLRKTCALFEEQGEKEINVNPYLHTLFLDVIGQVAFGIDLQAVENPTQEYADATGKYKRTIKQVVEDTSAGLNYRSIMPIKIFWHLPLKIFREEKIAWQILKNLFGKQIAQRKANPTENSEHTDLVGLLVNSTNDPDPKKWHYTEDAMLAECFSAFVAGHDSTASQSLFVLYHLAMHPEVQEKVRKEVEQIAKEHGEDPKNYMPTYADLNQMKYTEAVVKEGIRLNPFIGNTMREAKADHTFNGVFIPKGTIVLPNVYTFQQDPETFKNPTEYRPERWEENSGWTGMNPNQHQILLFGLGHRACFGKRLAMIQMKALVFTLCQQFELSTTMPKDLKTEFTFGARPVGGIMNIKFKKL